jgi:hypothetical protein
MSETAEDYAAMAEESKQRRANNREHSTQLLVSKGYAFTSHNQGAHLIVHHKGRVWNFWPGTGKWNLQGYKQYYRGVQNLIKAMEGPDGNA